MKKVVNGLETESLRELYPLAQIYDKIQQVVSTGW